MKYVNEFQNVQTDVLLNKIKSLLGQQKIIIMEVCGTHTMAIARYGIRSLLPENIKLLSGPGCPVCVTSVSDVDLILQCARIPNVILCTFGDMIRVPGSESSLEYEKQKGADIRVVTSTHAALNIAEKNPDKEIVFAGIGFETTIPTVAISIQLAKANDISNYSVLSLHKTMPAALQSLCDSKLKVDGFLLPGHVSTIIGAQPYQFISDKFKKSCAIAGFEPFDILLSIYFVVKQHVMKKTNVEIEYNRVVSSEGNLRALEIIHEVFYSSDVYWRGLGMIPQSGLQIRKSYADYDASIKFKLNASHEIEDKSGCQCGHILRGHLEPSECKLFGTQCTPETPIGPCMVSSEGVCAAQFQYQII